MDLPKARAYHGAFALNKGYEGETIIDLFEFAFIRLRMDVVLLFSMMGRHAESCVHRVVSQMIGGINIIPLGPEPFFQDVTFW